MGMSCKNTLGDILNNIKNAQKKRILIQTVKVGGGGGKVIGLLKVLEKNGYIRGFVAQIPQSKGGKVEGRGQVRILLKYEKEKGAIRETKIISKPSKRVYIKAEEMERKEKGKEGITNSAIEGR